MTTKDTSGPAFPIPLNKGQSWHGMAPCDGMTLRDYFAAKAMQSLIDSSRYSGVIGLNCYEHTLSALAYKQADAMLAERNKP